MKAVLYTLGALGAVLGVLSLWRTFSGVVPASPALEERLTAAPEAPPTPPPQPPPPGPGFVPFASLPLNQPRPFDCLLGETLKRLLTMREQRDQVLDWMLYAAVADAGLSPDEVNRVLFDVPAVRHDYLQPFVGFEYGPTRACFIGDGRVLALVPACENEAVRQRYEATTRKDHLADIADEYRKTLGAVPRVLLVFEYEIGKDLRDNTLTRRADVPGADLFTPEAGYHEQVVDDLPSFERFLAAAEDITYAGFEGGKLRLGGRKLSGRRYRGLRVEDVAAVWQAQVKLKRDREGVLARFEREQKELQAVWQQKLTTLNDAHRQDPGKMTEKEYQAAAAELQAGYDREAKALQTRQAERYHEMHLSDHTGFSLDLDWDYDGLNKWVDKDGRAQLARHSTGPDAVLSAETVENVRSGLRHKDVIHLLVALDKLKKSDQELANLTAERVSKETDAFRFQKARYDGELQGTEVGMVLFYTDLLAKLWEMDYQKTLPRLQIPDFAARTDGGTSILYAEQVRQYAATRLWFGPEDRAFQLVRDRQGILFARRVMRIFSASSNTLAPGREVEADYSEGRINGWWNDHFEEVARYEPEYERLNEYIKWTLVLGWLEWQRREGDLAFLSVVPVDRSAWFPDWAAKKGEQLRYNRWRAVGFFPRGRGGSDTETMPILVSDLFSDFSERSKHWFLSGGVSGARSEDLEARPSLPVTPPPGLLLTWRGLDLRGLDPSGKSLTTLRGSVYEFTEPTQEEALLRWRPPKGRSFRSRFREVAPTTLTRTVTVHGPETLILTRTEAVELGELRITSGKEGLRVRYRSRDFDTSQALVRDLSVRQDRRHRLNSDARVERYQELGEGAFLIKQYGCRKWLKIALWKPSANLPGGWGCRVADTVADSEVILLAWVESPESRRWYAPTARPPLVESLEAGWTEEANRLFLANPEAARRTLAEDLSRRQAVIDRFLAQNRHDEAIEMLETALRVHRRNAALLARYHAARLDPGSP
jgi:hypothetical protein